MLRSSFALLSLAWLSCGLACAAEAPPPPAPARHVAVVLGPDTTVITAPLNADGTPNYLAAINARLTAGVTAENNAGILLLRALGPDAIPRTKTRDQVYTALHLAPLPENGPYYTDLTQFVQWRRGQSGEAKLKLDDDAIAKVEDAVIAKPWHAADYPLADAWLRANEEPLALIVAASHCPRYYIPMASTYNPPLLLDGSATFSLGRFTSVTKALIARALLKTSNGDVAGAREDLMAVHRLARLVDQYPFLIFSFVAIHTDTRALKAEQAILRSHVPTFEEATALLTNLRVLPEFAANPADVLQGERLFPLEFALAMARYPIDPLLQPYLDPKAHLPPAAFDKTDWTVALRAMNHRLDALAVMAHEPIAARRAVQFQELRRQDQIIGLPDSDDLSRLGLTQTPEFADPKHELHFEKLAAFFSRRPGETLPAYSERVAAFFTQFDSSTEQSLILFDRATAQHRLTVLAAALAVYHADHGSYPKSLDALSAVHGLTTIPLDPFSGRSFVYHTTPTGYLLYSVGDNGIDDGGKDKPAGGDDITVSMP